MSGEVQGLCDLVDPHYIRVTYPLKLLLTKCDILHTAYLSHRITSCEWHDFTLNPAHHSDGLQEEDQYILSAR